MIYIICAPSAKTDDIKPNDTLENVELKIDNHSSLDQGKNGLMLLKCKVQGRQMDLNKEPERTSINSEITDCGKHLSYIKHEIDKDMPNYTTNRSQKGNDIVVHNENEYVLHQKVKNIVYYRCRMKGCRGRGKITDDLFTVTVQHNRCTNHTTQPIKPLKLNSTQKPKTKIILEKEHNNQDSTKELPTLRNKKVTKKLKSTSPQARDANYDTSPEIEYITSQRGGYILYYKKFLYHHSYNRSGILVYRCRIRDCKGRLRVRARAVKAYRTHSHPDDEAEYFKLMSRQKLKQAVIESPSTPMIKVYGEVLEDLMAKYPHIATIPDALPKYYSVEKTLMRATKTGP